MPLESRSHCVPVITAVGLCRQGDPGSTRYFLSLEDNMFRIFGGERVKSMMGMFQIEDLPIESGLLVCLFPYQAALHPKFAGTA